MPQDLILGVISLAVAIGLFLVALPKKNEECARFLRFHSAMTFYPALILIFAAFGSASLISWYLTTGSK